MVVRPSAMPSERPEINREAKSKKSSISTMANGRASPKLKHSNSVLHARKTTSLSPARPIPRSKSMNGLNRVDSNKIKANGVDVRGKKAPSPQPNINKNDHPGKMSRGGNE